MSAEYRIASLADFAKIPPDRLDACLADFGAWLRWLGAQEAVNEATTKMLGAPAMLANDLFFWADDGIVGVTGIVVECEGEILGRVSVGGK